MDNTIDVTKIAAFSDGNVGGNPAGVVIYDSLPPERKMQQIAADVGYSETVFAMPQSAGWRVRYFSPLNEVSFCGHATIALGAALAADNGNGIFALTLNDADITVEGRNDDGKLWAALQSPQTKSEPVESNLLQAALSLFGYVESDLHPEIPAAHANAGANHLVIGLNTRQALRAMDYDFEKGRELMNEANLVTIVLAYPESPSLFHTRNPFASGGVYEDPATGAGTAALAGYLRDLGWPHDGAIDVIQGEDMGVRSLLHAEIPSEPGSSIRVSGAARFI